MLKKEKYAKKRENYARNEKLEVKKPDIGVIHKDLQQLNEVPYPSSCTASPSLCFSTPMDQLRLCIG